MALLNQLEYDQKSGLAVMVADVAALVSAEYAKVRTLKGGYSSDCVLEIKGN
ncbi:hypothetical protein [Achromobacter sp. K91]|uniref:hypothetical protein n=1 Tax=Achromobacter sp. K91 TaxID=2292262 RepID=UPI0013141F10|nr:hypothetical protein [Achromobacter sp. K91]